MRLSRKLPCVVALGAGLLVGAPGHAGPLPGQPVEPDWYVPRRGLDQKPEGLAPRNGERVLYINFDGALMKWCGSDDDTPVENCSTVFQGYVMPYTGGVLERAVMVQAIRKDIEDFAIVATDRRPAADVEYDMEMVGEWNPSVGGGFAGIAPHIDCYDNAGPGTSFTLEYSTTPLDLAKVVLQEVAHTWGLQHVEAGTDLLYPTVGGAADPSFVDQCINLVGSGDPVEALCPTQYAEHCPPSQQNSYRTILSLFGPSTPDTEPPTVEIVNPPDGGAVPVDFEIRLDLDDNNSPQLFETEVTLGSLFSDTVSLGGPGIGAIPLAGVPEGDYDLHVKVTDEDGNTAEDRITFTVDADAGGDTGTTGSGTAGTGSGTGATTTDSGAPETTGTSTGATTGGPGQVTDDGGCGCRSRSRSSGAGLLWALLPLVAVRRKTPRPVRK